MECVRACVRVCVCACVRVRVCPPLTVGQGDAGSVYDGLGQLVVAALQGHGGGLQRVPDLLAAVEGGRRVPELVPLAAQLALRHGVVALPLGPVLLQGLVAAWKRGMTGQSL